MSQQKLKVFDGQTVDGTSVELKSFRGGELVLSILKGSSLGGGVLELQYNLNDDGQPAEWIVAGTISDLATAGSLNAMIPFATAARLELTGAAGANLTAWLSTLH